MLLNTLKWLSFVATVLLVGQIRLKEDTVAGHFNQGVSRTITWAGNEIRNSKFVTNLPSTSLVQKWLNNVYPPSPTTATTAPAPVEVPPPPIAEAAPASVVPPAVEQAAEAVMEKVEEAKDTFNSTDRESILRLLD